MIRELLPVGAENAASKQLLMTVTGLSDRALRQQVARERRDGFPILTNMDSGGYYLPARPAETEKFILSMRNRAKEIGRIAAAVERSLATELGQQALDGWWLDG